VSTRSDRSLSARLLDIVLLVPALLVVLIEDVFWNSARALLRRLAALPLMRRTQKGLARLPAAAALLLFLVPEGLNHLAGLWAAVVLARGHVVTAIILAIVLKGGLTLLLVWIYQACEPTLMRVAWFARLHDLVFRARTWALNRIEPARIRLLSALRGSGWPVGRFRRRFRMVRWRLAAALDASWPRL
jgi:hypothetical protein